MARRVIHMNEVMEILYQWHQGASIKRVTRSLGYDRKTVRRYLRAAQDVGLKREEPFPDEQEMLGKLKAVLEKSTLVRQAPAQQILGGYRDEIEKLLTEKEMTAKQVMCLLAERHALKVSYASMLRYVSEEFNLVRPEATVHLETGPAKKHRWILHMWGSCWTRSQEKTERPGVLSCRFPIAGIDLCGLCSVRIHRRGSTAICVPSNFFMGFQVE